MHGQITRKAALLRASTVEELVDGGRGRRDARLAEARRAQEDAQLAEATFRPTLNHDAYPEVRMCHDSLSTQKIMKLVHSRLARACMVGIALCLVPTPWFVFIFHSAPEQQSNFQRPIMAHRLAAQVGCMTCAT